SAARPEPKTRALGPRGSPLWILPSRQRIHTEKIKETYIGDVTYIDEVDSALESTDTSDGCRTDSEEAGPRSPHLRGHRDPRARGHRAPRAAPQPEMRAGKGTCMVGGGPCAREGGSDGTASRTGPCSPCWLPGSPLRALSTNNCNNTHGQDPPVMGRGKRPTHGGARGGFPQEGAPSQPLAGPITPAPQEAARPPSEAAGLPRAQQQRDPAGSAAHGEPGRPASRKSSSASASGLKKLLCSLSQSTKQRLGRFRCYSMEQLPAPSGTSPDGPGMKKSPSLQSLRLVSPFCQPRKAASIQSLHPLLGKAPRASAYLLPQAVADRKGGSGPRRSLSVEDIGAPGRLRAVGRVVEVFPDGTSQLELQRPPHGAFGFCVTSGHGRPDTG
ncbi:Uncharacterized protein KIAA1614, partial [Charadrius vociferus]